MQPRRFTALFTKVGGAYILSLLLDASTWKEEHRHHLRLLFDCLQSDGLTVKAAKCISCASNIEFSVHGITPEGTQPLAANVKAIKDFLQLSSPLKLREFLGPPKFCRRFIPGCAHLFQPLTDLLRGSKTPLKGLQWNNAATKAFTAAEVSLSEATLLVHRSQDASDRVMVSSSSLAADAILQQPVNSD